MNRGRPAPASLSLARRAARVSLIEVLRAEQVDLVSFGLECAGPLDLARPSLRAAMIIRHYLPVARDLVVLVILAAILGTLGGPPESNPDHLGGKALHVLEYGGNPHFFRYPGLMIYLHAFVLAVVFEGMSVLGPAEDSHTVRSFVDSHRSLLDALGLSITLVFSAAGVVLTYLVTCRIVRDRACAFMAAFFLLTSVLWIADTHFATVDVPLAALTMAAVYYSLRFTAAGTPLTLGQMAGLGLWVGVAAAAKYPGALAAVAVAGSTWACYRQRRRLWILHGLAAGSVALAVFLAANPFLLAELDIFRADFIAELQHARTGHFGYFTAQGWLFHLNESLVNALGLPVLILAVAGLCWLVASRTIAPAAKWAVLLFPLTAYALIGNSHLAFQRYMLPVLPFVAVLAGVGAHAAWLLVRARNLFRSERTARWTICGLALAAALPNAVTVVRHDLILREEDTRSVLSRVVRTADLDWEGTTVSVQSYVSSPFPKESRLTSLKSLEGAQADLIVLDSFDHDRFLYHRNAQGRLHEKAALARVLAGQNLRRAHLIALSPFARPKSEVPFSPKSLYSPYPPDLSLRRAPGPFIEIYCRDRSVADRLLWACEELGVSCDRGRGGDGYYYRALRP